MRRPVYVYVHLHPGGPPVLAGVMISTTSPPEDPLGDCQAIFSYAPSYLRRREALAIDPFNLPLSSGRFQTERERAMEVFGAFRDAAPDSWGRALLERDARRVLSDVDLILAAGEDRSGFLAFGTSPNVYSSGYA